MQEKPSSKKVKPPANFEHLCPYYKSHIIKFNWWCQHTRVPLFWTCCSCFIWYLVLTPHQMLHTSNELISVCLKRTFNSFCFSYFLFSFVFQYLWLPRCAHSWLKNVVQPTEFIASREWLQMFRKYGNASFYIIVILMLVIFAF